MVMAEPDRENSTEPKWFVTTHWSVVLAAGTQESSQALKALETLCRVYWYPLYAFVRRLGQSPHDAEDLVQSFFAQCLEKNYLQAADQNKGRFRSFLLVALKRFLANEWDKSRAWKRGRGQPVISFDGLSPEERYALEPANLQSPEDLYERRWAYTLLERAVSRLEKEQGANPGLFADLKPFLTGNSGDAYATIAARWGQSEGAVKVAVHRLRKRYRELLEEEIANTVSSRDEVQEERRYLLSVLGR